MSWLSNYNSNSLNIKGKGQMLKRIPVVLTDKDEENKKIVLSFLDAQRNRDEKTLVLLIHEDYSPWDYQLPFSEIDQRVVTPDLEFPLESGREAFIKRLKQDWVTYTHPVVNVKKMMVKDGEVWVWYHISGYQTGPFMNIPPTNKLLEFDFNSIFQIKDGKIFRAGGVRSGSVLFQMGKLIVEENNEETIRLYMKKLREMGIIN